MDLLLSSLLLRPQEIDEEVGMLQSGPLPSVNVGVKRLCLKFGDKLFNKANETIGFVLKKIETFT